MERKKFSISPTPVTKANVILRRTITPPAPPVYRPQPTPQVLQRKATSVPAPPSASRPWPSAPQPYRPNSAPKVLQPKVVTPSGIVARTQEQRPLAPKPAGPPVVQCAWAPAGIVQLAARGHKKKAEKPEKKTKLKSGKLTKKAQKEAEAKAAAQLAAEREAKEEAGRQEWKKKHELGEKKGMTAEWETNPKFFNRYAKSAAARPAHTGAPEKAIPIVDLVDVGLDNPFLKALMVDALSKIMARPNTPQHMNNEHKLPIYGEGVVAPYWEFSFLGGGARIVVDAPGRIVYISMHYTYHYKLVDGGRTPAGPVTAARAQRSEVFRQEARARLAAAAARAGGGGGGGGAAAHAAADGV